MTNPAPASNPRVINVVVAGLGGQGVLTATDILADAAFRSGLDVKKSEVHGMSQRGGSVQGDIRFGERVFSPMVGPGEADYLLLLSADQFEPNRHLLNPGGIILGPADIELDKLPNRKSLNVALLGALSSLLSIPLEHWLGAMQSHLPEKILEVNQRAFTLGREHSPTP